LEQKKNEQLRNNRGICFEDILFYLDNKYLIDDVEHPKYSGQRMMVLNIAEYVYLIPYVESEDEIFLKTIIPSRRATRNYLEKNDE